MVNIIENRVYGSVLGQAIGDAMGHPVEFEKTHKVDDLIEGNTFTDDTQMFCAIGEALVSAPPHLDENEFMAELVNNFITWRNSPLGGTHRAPGGTCMEAVRKLGANVGWELSGAREMGKGNGSAMRSGVIGSMYWAYPEYAFRIGCLSSVPTHNNLEAILGAGMMSYSVAASIAGIAWPEVVADGIDLCTLFDNTNYVPQYPEDIPLDNTKFGQSPWNVVGKFARAYALGTSNITCDGYMRDSGDDFTVVPAVSEAIFFNSRFREFSQIIINAVNYGDDADTIGALAGAIAGSRFGVGKIEQKWLKGPKVIEQFSYLVGLAKRLWTVSKDVKIDAPSLMEEPDFRVEF